MPLARQFAATAAMPVYFCDPHSPWQRGSNENTTPAPPVLPQEHDLSACTRARLDAVAVELNARPRKTPR
jgi:transposase, IS30 family